MKHTLEQLEKSDLNYYLTPLQQSIPQLITPLKDLMAEEATSFNHYQTLCTWRRNCFKR